MGSWYATFIQAPPSNHKKPEFWNHLKKVGNLQKGPWLVIGNFKVVLNQNEKWGGKRFRFSQP